MFSRGRTAAFCVEASGIAAPPGVLDALKYFSAEKLEVIETVTVVDAARFPELCEVITPLLDSQIVAADRVAVTKVDEATVEAVDKTAAAVRLLVPAAPVYMVDATDEDSLAGLLGDLLYSRKAEILEKAMTMVRANFATIIAHGTLTQAAAEAAVACIRPTQSLAEAGNDADFVLETIAENKDAKGALYSELAAICPERTVFAGNTSSLNIFELLPASLQSRGVCAHFFTPAHVIPLVEVVPGPEASTETIELAVATLKKCGKNPAA
ncbi:MAG: hypothetical protein JW990_10655 [Thermoleophilia bacterium]|nr:hypothetical protein [Thermoleophilia bacterium]